MFIVINLSISGYSKDSTNTQSNQIIKKEETSDWQIIKDETSNIWNSVVDSSTLSTLGKVARCFAIIVVVGFFGTLAALTTSAATAATVAACPPAAPWVGLGFGSAWGSLGVSAWIYFATRP